MAAVSREWDFPNTPDSIHRARTAVREVVDDAANAETVEIVALLVSEVVTNAFRHGSGNGPVRVRVTVDDAIKVEVRDSGDGFVPAPRGSAQDEPGGWGLYLVGSLAKEWGAESDGGTRVWFTLPL
ncbi:MAG TPA: ATP-binding protein [Thermoleophilaceae bacterium]|nr:ATP-binding protein [Thermoleophilaceae bacterium]